MPRKGFGVKQLHPCPVHYTPMDNGVCPACVKLGGPNSKSTKQ